MEEYNYGVIRELVEAAFGDEELNRFCFDHFTDIYDGFTAGQTKGQRALALVDHARRHGLADKLLDRIAAANTHQYNLFKSRISGSGAPPSGDCITEPLPHAIPGEIIRPGGAIDVASSFYIEREMDRIVFREAGRPRSLVTVRAPRQTGKTSLILRVYASCRRGDIPVRPVYVDFQSISLQSYETVWLAVLEIINDQLDIGAGWDEIRQPEGNILVRAVAP